MPVLYSLLGIILFIVILFCIRLTVIFQYGENTVVRIKYLFINVPVLDTSKKKPKKDTKPEKAKSEKNKSVEKTKENSQKQKKQGNGFLKQLYIDHGYEGLKSMLFDLGESLSGFFVKLYKCFTIDELYIKMITAGSDAADTAIKHGKLCAWVYPVLGKLISTCKVKKYDFDISPDFLATKSTGEAFVRLHITPIRVTNAAVVLAIQLVFKILFKLLFSKKKSDKSKELSDTKKTADGTNSATVENDNATK